MDFQVEVDGMPVTNGTKKPWECAYNPVGKSGGFLFRDKAGIWRRRDTTLTRLMLKANGLNGAVKKGEDISEVDQAIKWIIQNNEVDFAMPLAGYRAGLVTFNERRVLVTRERQMLKADHRPWPTLKKFLTELLGEDALEHHMGWWQWARKSIRGDQVLPGQAMVYVGKSGVGKSWLQKQTTKLLGGDMPGKPFNYMTGKTTFNSDLFLATHLMIEDEFANMDMRGRREFGARLKELVVNETVPCHAKGVDAILLKPKWRVSVSLNDEEEHLQVLPPLEPSILDKLMLFMCNVPTFPYDLSTEEGWQQWDAVVEDELPGLAHAIDSFKIPTRLQNSRYGVKPYHAKAITHREAEASIEEKLMHIIDHDLPMVTSEPYWEGRSLDLERELSAGHMPSCLQTRKLFQWNGACGTYLGRLAKKYPTRITKRCVRGTNQFRITLPKKT